MKTVKTIITAILLLASLLLKAEVKEIPFTLDDRDRIIRTEQKVEALNAKVDSKVDGLRSEMNARFDQLFNFLWAIIGIFTTMMISVFGFAFWDRKLSLAPLKKDDQKIISVLADYAKTQPKLLEIMKNAGLM
jgi:hypothetical protein